MTATEKIDDVIDELRKRTARKDQAAYRIVGCVQAFLAFEDGTPVSPAIDVLVKRLRVLAEEFEAIR